MRVGLFQRPACTAPWMPEAKQNQRKQCEPHSIAAIFENMHSIIFRPHRGFQGSTPIRVRYSSAHLQTLSAPNQTADRQLRQHRIKYAVSLYFTITLIPATSQSAAGVRKKAGANTGFLTDAFIACMAAIATFGSALSKPHIVEQTHA